jgi:hypothetical protein
LKEDISIEARKAQKFSQDEACREAARKAAVQDKRAKAPIFSPDLHAMLLVADADKRALGLPAHTMESFLLHMQTQVNHPKATHQNSAPQDPMEQELHRNHGRSQGALVEEHSEKDRQ